MMHPWSLPKISMWFEPTVLRKDSDDLILYLGSPQQFPMVLSLVFGPGHAVCIPVDAGR